MVTKHLLYAEHRNLIEKKAISHFLRHQTDQKIDETLNNFIPIFNQHQNTRSTGKVLLKPHKNQFNQIAYATVKAPYSRKKNLIERSIQECTKFI